MINNKVQAHGMYGHICIGIDCNVMGCGFARNLFEGHSAILQSSDITISLQKGGIMRGDGPTLIAVSAKNRSVLTKPKQNQST